MFRQLFTTLAQGSALDEAFDHLGEMLEHAEWMFQQANRVIRLQVDPEEVKDAIYSRDQAVNKLLKKIRGHLVRHLTVNPGNDAPGCLALMSVAKDAERLGDYCKNVFEVGRFYHEEFHVSTYHEPLDAIEKEVESLFSEVRQAWTEFDTAKAKASIKHADAIGERCDAIVEQLLQDQTEMKTEEAVSYSLLSRHYKRVASHLSNVCTAVMGRIEDLDFRLK